MILFAGKSHPGYKRSHNEDCYLTDPDLGLFLVADGVGDASQRAGLEGDSSCLGIQHLHVVREAAREQ